MLRASAINTPPAGCSWWQQACFIDEEWLAAVHKQVSVFCSVHCSGFVGGLIHALAAPKMVVQFEWPSQLCLVWLLPREQAPAP